MKRMIMNRNTGLVILLLFFRLNGFSQTERSNYYNDIPALLEEQTDSLSKVIQQVLKAYPARLNIPSAERRLALYAIDGLLHDTRLDTTNAIRSFIKDRNDLVLNDLKKTAPKKGMRIYKLYNHGFLIRTATVTIGFDLVLGNIKALAKTGNGSLIDAAQMKEIVNSCDALFVSHVHEDHADLKVAKMFAAEQKPVFTTSGMWEKESPYIQALRGTGVLSKEVTLKNGQLLTVKVFPGHQGEVLNNIYSISTPEGYTVMHTGDQHNKKDVAWLQKVHEIQQVDVLLVNTFIDDFKKTVEESIQPKLAISSHQNEMGHTIDHRGPYWSYFRRMKSFKVPFVMMTWGEQYLYQ